jgi:hypothetical protein
MSVRDSLDLIPQLTLNHTRLLDSWDKGLVDPLGERSLPPLEFQYPLLERVYIPLVSFESGDLSPSLT